MDLLVDLSESGGLQVNEDPLHEHEVIARQRIELEDGAVKHVP